MAESPPWEISGFAHPVPETQAGHGRILQYYSTQAGHGRILQDYLTQAGHGLILQYYQPQAGHERYYKIIKHNL